MKEAWNVRLTRGAGGWTAVLDASACRGTGRSIAEALMSLALSLLADRRKRLRELDAEITT